MKFEDYKAPWEIDSTGADIAEDEQQIDKSRLKRFLFGLHEDKSRLQGTVSTLTEQNKELQGKVDEKTREGQTEDQRREQEVKDAIEAAEAKGSLPALKLDVALDIEGITPKAAKALAKRLTGTTREELEADAKDLVEQFGIVKAQEPDENDDEGSESPARLPRVPRAQGDPAPQTPRDPDFNDPAVLERHFPR